MSLLIDFCIFEFYVVLVGFLFCFLVKLRDMFLLDVVGSVENLFDILLDIKIYKKGN